jgi:hypothetical protein
VIAQVHRLSWREQGLATALSYIIKEASADVHGVPWEMVQLSLHLVRASYASSWRIIELLSIILLLWIILDCVQDCREGFG